MERETIEKSLSIRFSESCYEQLKELSKQCRPEPKKETKETKETITELLIRNPYLANFVAASVVASVAASVVAQFFNPRLIETHNIIRKEYGSIDFLLGTPFMRILNDSLSSNEHIETNAQIKLWALYHLVVDILNNENSIFNSDRKLLITALEEIEKFVSDIEGYSISGVSSNEDLKSYESRMKIEIYCFMREIQQTVKEEKYSVILDFPSYFEAE